MTDRADVVIVNYNTGPLLRRCLDSLAAARASGAVGCVFVVDNASSDASLFGVESDYPFVTVLANESNRGFAAACNQGAARAQAEFLLFLNPDAGVYPDTVERAVSVFRREEFRDVGIVGVPLLDENGRVAITCSRLPRLRGFLFKALGLEGWAARRGWSQPMREWGHGETRVVEQVMGAFFLMPRALFRELGGFDERFFVYFEEVDLSARARARGRLSLFFAETRAFHTGCGSSERLKAHRLFYSLRSRLLYGAKHFSPVRAWLLLPLTLLLEPAARAAQLAARRDRDGLCALNRGLGWLWRDAPNWWPVWRRLRGERR